MTESEQANENLDPQQQKRNEQLRLVQQFAIRYFAVLVASVVVSRVIIGALALMSNGNVSLGAGIGIMAAFKLPLAVLLAIHGRRIESKSFWLLGIAAMLPVVHWFVFYHLLKRTPLPASEGDAEPRRVLPIIGAVTVFLLPFVCPFLIWLPLTAARYDYMSQLFTGPEGSGAYLPGTEIPFGYGLIAVMLVIVLVFLLPATGIVWMSLRRRSTPQWLSGVVPVWVVLAYLFPISLVLVYFVILGPATVELYKAFFLGT